MSKSMFLMHLSYSARRKRSLKTAVWSVNCYTGHDVVSQLDDAGAAPNSQIKNRRRKKRSPCQLVLDCFDQQYGQELGDLWASSRAVLLDSQSWQHGVMLNRFSTGTDISQILQSEGFSKLLPQTGVSTLLCSGSSKSSNSQYQAGKDFLLPHDYVSTCPYHEDRLQADSISHVLSLPRSTLRCYIHRYPLRFPSQAHRPGQLKHYYLLNAASLLPVLALQVRDGEKVLDLCSAPGGKAVAIMQCATPARLCCNEPDTHRRDWLVKTLESYLPQSLISRVIVSAKDGRWFGQSEVGAYDKVLVDAPCSNDRSWLYSCSVQQGEQRLREKARLPVLQAQLLRSALSAVRPGGVVVYSTCTLSRSENCAVVETVLNDCPEAEPEDLWEEIVIPLSKYFTFNPAYPGHGQNPPKPSLQTSYQPRLGLLVVPQPGKTWGPMYLSRIRRR